MVKRKRILICPLDWGLGHATRCVPVIRLLMQRDADVFIGSSGSALQLLKQEFPTLSFFELPSYRPVYPSSGSMALTLIGQLPKFGKVIRAEHLIIEKVIDDYKIDVVISDNRYGCWSPKVKSVFITHQVNLRMPPGFAWASSAVNYFLQRSIRKFNELWIPDLPAGELTAYFSSTKFPNQKYIGWLSRFSHGVNVPIRYDIIALVSGPEPQRSIFQDLLVRQVNLLELKALLVTGEPGKLFHQKGDLEIVNHLAASELGDAINASRVVVCRSGYSSVMDLIALGKNAIFVATPQQPEQLFFARYLKEKNIAFSVDQDKFQLKEALEKSKEYKGLAYYQADPGLLTEAIDSLFL